VKELLERCYRAGLKVSISDAGNLKVSLPDTPEAESLLEELRAHKQEVINYLSTSSLQGGHLARLAVEPELRRYCHCTLRPRIGQDVSRTLEEIVDLCERNPGREPVLVDVFHPDGSTQQINLQAHADRGVRKVLAMIVLDCNLGAAQRAFRGQPPVLNQGGRDETPIQR
jgi:hypothetical protein